MTATVVLLLPAKERALLQAYVEGTSEPYGAGTVYDALEVPHNATPTPGTSPARTRLAIAVAQILLRDTRLTFNPQRVCTVNWFGWPEEYHVTYLLGFNKFVVTASHHPDGWGCAAHAIGVRNGRLKPVQAAKKVLTEFWRGQVLSWEQPRWPDLYSEGLIDKTTANAWADEVWRQPEEEEEEEETPDAA